MGVIIALALQGLISLEGGIALALGANIGTCATAGLAAIGKPREAVRVAVAHVTFKIAGVAIIFAFIPYLAELVRWISPAAPAGLSGMDKLAAETPRQIANAHTIFNVGIAFLFLPLSAQFARFCEWVVPDKPLEEALIIKAKYLDAGLLSTPALALDRTRMEIGHMGQHVEAMLQRMMPAVLGGDQTALREVAKMDDDVDILHGQIVTYLGKVSQNALSEQQTTNFLHLMDAVNDLENIGDIIETDLVTLGRKRIDDGITVSEETRRVLGELHHAVADTVSAALKAVMENDQRAAQEVIARKSDINRLMEGASQHQAGRLVAEAPKRLATYRIEVDIIEKLKRIYYFAKRMAKVVAPPELTQKAGA
jgi:phosphate:Na+ symporter